jgi:hypothetical protein
MSALDVIEALLALSAAYCGGAWLWVAVRFWRVKDIVRRADNAAEIRRDVQAATFHLGLCFILALGFLGLLLG